jgi:hypothetical protein
VSRVPVRYNAEPGDGCRACDGQAGIGCRATVLVSEEEGAVHRYRTGGPGLGARACETSEGGQTPVVRRTVSRSRQSRQWPGVRGKPGPLFLLTVTRNGRATRMKAARPLVGRRTLPALMSSPHYRPNSAAIPERKTRYATPPPTAVRRCACRSHLGRVRLSAAPAGSDCWTHHADCSKASEGDIRREIRTPRVSARREPARLVDIEMAREGLRQYPGDIGSLR